MLKRRGNICSLQRATAGSRMKSAGFDANQAYRKKNVSLR
ncbi:hypothetical protein PAMC26510_04405 [Caballeronia sordidicola]|uniref:Uncharacterized protein n=1 Tax=Caballeronia sordidicola TaxID=196367 RepID=A0A242N8M7_CABSO|nr:hypothetical protein PAMC26510_04405 [Caballeronia sordidicola]